jgi:hypothetical protein
VLLILAVIAPAARSAGEPVSMTAEVRNITIGRLQLRVAVRPDGPSVRTAAWVSCSPSTMDSASHGWARTFPKRAAPSIVGSQKALS